MSVESHSRGDSSNHPTAEGIDLLVGTIRNSRWLILAAVVFCVAAAIVLRLQIVDNYEGQATVSLSVVGGEPVEQAGALALRLSSMATKEAVLKELAIDPKSERGQVLTQSFKANGTDSKLELSVRDLTADGVRQVLAGFIGVITRSQEEQAAIKTSELKTRLSLCKTLAASAEEKLTNGTRLVSRSLQECIAAPDISNKCLLVLLLRSDLAASANDLRTYRSEADDLARKLGPEQNRKLAIEDLHASKDPVTPSTRHVIVLAVFLGLVVGVAGAIAMETARRFRGA